MRCQEGTVRTFHFGRMKENTKAQLCAVGIWLLGIGVSGAAVTPVQTSAFAGDDDGVYTDLGDGNFISASAESAISGFTKFDASLGTLTDVLLTVEVDATISMVIEADVLDPIDAPVFSFYLDPISGGLIQAGMLYSPTGGIVSFVVTSDNTSLSSLGTEFEDPAPYIFDFGGGPAFFYSDSYSESFGGFSSGGTTAATGSLSALDPDFLASDFIGTGAVTGLSMSNILNYDNDPSELSLLNVPYGFVQPEVSFSAGNATLQYVYTPIPEPSVGMLVLLGALVSGRRRR